jgi:hypothetical protein
MFVAAELAKRGYSVSLTMGNAKAVDLFAEYEGEAICIQVKAIARKKNVGWPLPFKKDKIIDGATCVCVVLNEINEPPTYNIRAPSGRPARTLGRICSNTLADPCIKSEVTVLRETFISLCWS